MPFGLGFFATAGGAAPVAAGDYDLLTTTLVGTATASVSFDTSTFTDYKHLQIRATVRSSNSSTYDEMYMRFNTDTTASNYKSHLLYGTGSGVGSGVWDVGTIGFRFADPPAVNATGSAYMPFVADILDFNGNKNKTVRAFSGTTTTPFITLASGLWMSTTTVSSIVITSKLGNIAVNSRFSLYGLKG